MGAGTKSNAVEAILWDNDGVLVDTEPLYLQASRETLEHAGIPLSEAAYREISLRQGGSVFVLAARQGFPPRRIEKMRRQRDQRYAELLDGEIRVLDGVRSTLASLSGRIPMGIVTSSRRSHFDRIHRATGLVEYFDFVLASGDYDHHKPHPDPYLTGAARLGVDAVACLAIEDTERGLQSAVAAGMRCLVIPHRLSAGGDFARAHRILGSAHEVPDAVEALLGAPGVTPGPDPHS